MSERRPPSMEPRRIESLADGIFAFAMTLLVLSINAPEPAKVVNVGPYLWAQSHNFWNFAMSFLLLALFWTNFSQQLHHIKRTDATLVMTNIVTLLFVALIPFSASLVNDYTGVRVAEVFFSLNMLALSGMLALNWYYAYKQKLLDVDSNPEHIARVNKRGYITPLVALIALVVAIVSPGWATTVYLLIPVFMFLRK